jgi:hypothetical protein
LETSVFDNLLKLLSNWDFVYTFENIF